MSKALLILFFPFFCLAQEGKMIRIVNAESLSFDKERGDAQVLRGNVICEHEGTFLHCDTALIYEHPNRMIASGHILITKGDSIRITSEKLEYDGRTKMAALQGNVRCVENDMTLTTNVLTFDVKRSIASYFSGGTLVNRENTLVSRNGHYYSGSKEAAFHYDVVLTNPDYTMRCDTLRYRVNSKTAFFLGPASIVSESDSIYCENGWYDTNREKARFSRNAVYVTGQQTLKGDSLVYDRLAGEGRAFRNVSLVDTSQKSVLYGQYIEYRKDSSEAFATDGAIYVRVVENDSLFLSADTLYHKDLDSVNNFVSAYHHVRIFKSNLQALCDSATVNSRDSLMQLFNNPVLWSGRMQATSRLIEVFIGKNTVKGFRLSGKAFMAEQVDSLDTEKFQQLSGKTIDGVITRDTMRKVTVTGNAEMLYYPKNDRNIIGLNKTVSSEIHVWFRNGEAERVTMMPKTTGNVDPLKDVNTENARLRGFTWMGQKRPRSRQDLRRPGRETPP